MTTIKTGWSLAAMLLVLASTVVDARGGAGGGGMGGYSGGPGPMAPGNPPETSRAQTREQLQERLEDQEQVQSRLRELERIQLQDRIACARRTGSRCRPRRARALRHAPEAYAGAGVIRPPRPFRGQWRGVYSLIASTAMSMRTSSLT